MRDVCCGWCASREVCCIMIASRRRGAGGGAPPPPKRQRSAADVVHELRDLKALLDSGALTSKEFDELKAKLLRGE